MAHIKHLAKVGNSYAIRLDRALLEVLDITEDTPLKIEISTISGNQIIITPIEPEMDERSAEFEKAFQEAYEHLKPVLHLMPDLPRNRARKAG